LQAYYHHKDRFVLKVIWHVNKTNLRFIIHYFINNLLIVVFYANIYMKVLKLIIVFYTNISKITIHLKKKGWRTFIRYPHEQDNNNLNLRINYF